MNGLANEKILENQIMFHVVKHTDFRTSERSYLEIDFMSIFQMLQILTIGIFG